MSQAPCPQCKKPMQEAYRPFCSKRCADVDLHKWLTGAYVIPGGAHAEGPGHDLVDADAVVVGVHHDGARAHGVT